MDGWLTLGLGEIAQGFAARPKAEPVPGADKLDPIDFGTDLTQDLISLTREFSPREIGAMRTEARRGTPRRLYGLIDEMPRFGPGTQMSKVRRDMKSADFRIQPPAPLREDKVAKTAEGKRAAEIAGYLSAQFLPFMPVFANAAATREIYGIAALTMKWLPGAADGGRDLLVAVREIPPRHFALNRDQKWVFLPDPQVQTDEVPIAPLVEASALLFLEAGKDTPLDQRGLAFQVLVPWCMAQYGWRWFSKFVELCGIPMRTIEFPSGSAEFKKLAEEIGKKAGAGGWAAYPTGMKFNFISALAGASNGKSSHEPFLEYAERCFDKVFLGHSQASAVNAGDGSVQSSDKATDETRALCASRLVDLAADMRAYCGPLVARNFSPQDATRYAPEHTYAPPTVVDRKAEGEILVAAKNSGAARGIALADAVERLGYRMALPGEETLADAAAEQVADDAEAEKTGKAPKGKGKKVSEDEDDAEKLARVVEFPFAAKRGSQAPPDVETPAGVAEQMLAPYRGIFASAISEGESPHTALIRVIQRAKSGEPEAEHVTNMLASALLGGTMRGIVAAREART